MNPPTEQEEDETHSDFGMFPQHEQGEVVNFYDEQDVDWGD